MLRKLSGLAAVLVTAGACHSGGTYLQSAEPRPYGPGVVDCSWFQNTENAYLREGCMTPGPVAEVQYVAPVWPRAARGDAGVGCPLPGGVVMESASAPAVRVAVVPAAAPVRVQQPVVVVEPPRTTWRPEPTARDFAPPMGATPTGSASVTPGVEWSADSVPDWNAPVPPPRPGAPLPRPRSSSETWGR